jgi:hypothetical protein
MGIRDSITSTVSTTCKNVCNIIPLEVNAIHVRIFWGSLMLILTEQINYCADILHSSEAKRKFIVK